MINNDVIRSIRYMLNISEAKLVDIVKLGDGNATALQMNAFIKKEDEQGYVLCDEQTMTAFLNGLIYFKRGKDESRPPPPVETLTNNVVLKKLRVAFELKDEDVLELVNQAEFKITKPEINAFFRKVGHVNYRDCQDQVLRYFLKGLTAKIRK